jgi:prepilin-type processing-associated H-X9-DG protein
MRQVGQAFWMYLQDYDERMPDRRDLKRALGYRLWSSWARVRPPLRLGRRCAGAVHAQLGYLELPPASQAACWARRCRSAAHRRPTPHTLLDVAIRPSDEPIPPDNFWGKTPDQAVADLQANPSPFYTRPEGLSDVELMVDPYFPRTISAVAPALRGRAVHRGGRNRLFLDGHIRWLRDIRTE